MQFNMILSAYLSSQLWPFSVDISVVIGRNYQSSECYRKSQQFNATAALIFRLILLCSRLTEEFWELLLIIIIPASLPVPDTYPRVGWVHISRVGSGTDRVITSTVHLILPVVYLREVFC